MFDFAPNIARQAAEIISPGLAAAQFTATDAGAALIADQVYPSLTAMDLGQALTVPTAFAGMTASVLDASLRSGRYAEAAIAAALDRLTPPDTVKALTFDGVTTQVSAGSPASLTNLRTFAATVWVRLDPDPARPQGTYDILGRAGAQALLGVSGGKYVASLGGADTRIEAAIPPEDAGAWVHLAVNWDGTTISLCRYGVDVANKTLAPGLRPAGSEWLIGGPQLWRGGLRALALWSEGSIRSHQLQLAMGGGRPLVRALVADWPLSDGSGTTCHDRCAAGPAATITAGAWTAGPALPDPLWLALGWLKASDDMARVDMLRALVPNLTPLTALGALRLAGATSPWTQSGFTEWFPTVTAAEAQRLWNLFSPTAPDPTNDELARALAAAGVPAARALPLTAGAGAAFPLEWALVTLKRAGYTDSALIAVARAPVIALSADKLREATASAFHDATLLAKRRMEGGASTALAWLRAAYPDLPLADTAVALVAAGAPEAGLGSLLRNAFPTSDANALAAAYMVAFKPG